MPYSDESEYPVHIHNPRLQTSHNPQPPFSTRQHHHHPTPSHPSHHDIALSNINHSPTAPSPSYYHFAHDKVSELNPLSISHTSVSLLGVLYPRHLDPPSCRPPSRNVIYVLGRFSRIPHPKPLFWKVMILRCLYSRDWEMR